MLMGERDVDNILPGYTTVGQNATEGILCKSFSDVVIHWVRRRARVFVGDSIVRKTDRALRKGTTWWFAFQEQNRGCHREGGNNRGSGQGRFYFSTCRD